MKLFERDFDMSMTNLVENRHHMADNVGVIDPDAVHNGDADELGHNQVKPCRGSMLFDEADDTGPVPSVPRSNTSFGSKSTSATE